MKPVKHNKARAWDILLLVIRIWLGYRLIAASYSSVIDILTSAKERAFFQKWFGDELHFPIPVVMAFLAKGAEVAGGVFVLMGLFTRTAASLIAFTMIIATLTANLGENWVIDGGFTISYTLFAFVLIFWGSGRYGTDYLILQKKQRSYKNPDELYSQ
jgi:uncharacterized membrane protein YphA (DoxX/SURF4 family)